MKTFKDTEAREWEIRINVGTIGRVRDGAGVDLIGLYAGGMGKLAEFVADPVGVVKVLWCLVEKRAAERKIEPEQFGEAFSGDVLEAATFALLEELADFSPSPKAKAIRAMLKKMRETTDVILTTGMKRIEAINPEAEAASILATLEKNGGTSSGDAAASSASTPSG